MSYGVLRNIESSFISYIRTQMKAVYPTVKTIKSFADVYTKELPVICLRLDDISVNLIEIGSSSSVFECNINLDMFCQSDSQRLDFTSTITPLISNGCEYYEHEYNATQKNTTKVKNGYIQTVNILQNTRLNFSQQNIESRDKFRQFINFVVTKR